MVVGKYMGKYPKFNVIDTYNTKWKKQNCENYFSGSQGMSKEWLQAILKCLSACLLHLC